MASAFSASAKGASYLILIQITSRALTFVINQALIRFLSPELLGASTHLELYSISVLYFARESLRVALQRQTGGLQAVVNASYISVALGIPLAIAFALLYAQSSLPDVPFIVESLLIYAFASIVELFAEPSFVVTQQKLRYKVRALAETAAAILKCLATFITVLWFHRRQREPGVLPFALGQLCYATSLLIVYYVRTRPVAKTDGFSLFIKPIKSKSNAKAVPSPNCANFKPGLDDSEYIWSYFSKSLLTLGLNLYVQSGIKYVLTQGDAFLITSMATLQQQGAYALASNYGGLIARMLFQPIEESSRNLFAKISTPKSNSTVKVSKENITQARDTLRDILKFYNIIALVSWSIGPALAPLLLQLIAGDKWSSTGAGYVLATYCYYIPLLALNGVTEAFVAAVATNSQLRTQSVLMGAYFFGFAGAAYVFLRVMKLGARGLVWANCVNMLLRIIWNTKFIKNYFIARDGRTFGMMATLPTVSSCAASMCVATILRISPRTTNVGNSLLSRLLQDGLVAAVFGVVLLVLERDFIMRCYLLTFPDRKVKAMKFK